VPASGRMTQAGLFLTGSLFLTDRFIDLRELLKDF
jgi:hypothetical protein